MCKNVAWHKKKLFKDKFSFNYQLTTVFGNTLESPALLTFTDHHFDFLNHNEAKARNLNLTIRELPLTIGTN